MNPCAGPDCLVDTGSTDMFWCSEMCHWRWALGKRVAPAPSLEEAVRAIRALGSLADPADRLAAVFAPGSKP